MEKRILTVDDEDQVRDFLSTVLEENGYVPLVAKNGEEAMTIIEQDRPDLVIMDVLMPEQSGIRMYRLLKSSDALRDIPVIIYSGIAKRTFLRTQAAREEAGEARIPDPEYYIEKPTKPEFLAEVIKRLLEAR